jgi:hypothetical protein
MRHPTYCCADKASLQSPGKLSIEYPERVGELAEIK